MTKIAILGDSVMWGQGLLDQHKIGRLVAAALGGSPPASAIMCAHSGGIIGANYSGNETSKSSEVPVPAPTILKQVDLFENPFEIDLVLVNGGINDVDFRVILDPFTTDDHLSSVTSDACYRDMKVLLQTVVKVFNKTSVKIIVSGYYPIISSLSHPLRDEEKELLERLLGHFALGVPLTIERDLVVNHIVAHSLSFWHESNEALSSAVNEIGQSLNMVKRLQFVPTPFSEENALFADDPMLFEFSDSLGTQDEVASSRAAACDLQYPNLDQFVMRESCHYASLGHPNVEGASRIATAIINAL